MKTEKITQRKLALFLVSSLSFLFVYLYALIYWQRLPQDISFQKHTHNNHPKHKQRLRFSFCYNEINERQDDMKFTVEYEQEEDGRWLAEVKELPGVLAYGKDADDAAARVQALALRVVADRIENGESAPSLMFTFAMA
ncbi:MAG: type II toxin-antitoxin system HicB family antitoxin [Anaerolineales bacterium]|nr:type II toxin-antitoxin system HicB family antitoxin [Anaerolineales bacterium]